MEFSFLNDNQNTAESGMVAGRIRGVCSWIRENKENPQFKNINPYETIDLALDALTHTSPEAHTLMGEIWEMRKGSVPTYLLADESTALYQMYETLIHAETAPAGVLENRDFFKLLIYRNAYTRSAVTEGKDVIHINDGEFSELRTLREKAHSGDESTKDVHLLHLADCMLQETYQAMQTNKFSNVIPQLQDELKK